jgi:hypothetical protein
VIAKGTLHNSGRRLADYMTTGKDNEKAALWQLKGFASDEIKAAFRSIDVLAKGTRAEKPFFHVQVRNPADEELTKEQWERVADRIEVKLGYSGQPRAIAFHQDVETGHEHMHVAWSRIDGETLQAKPLPFFKLRLKEVCRELEVELDLTRVSSDRPRVELAPSRNEEEQSRRLDTDLHGIRGTIRAAYEQSDGGKAFAAALADQGLTLCQGERRDFIVIDAAGGMHALGKRLLGDSAAQVRHHLADLPHEALPTVAEAREHLVREAPAITMPVLQQEREAIFASFAERRAERAAMEPANENLSGIGHELGQAGRHVERGLGGVAQVAQGVAGGVQNIAIGIERFFFGGGEAPARPVYREPESAARQFKRETDLMRPEEALASADFHAKKETFTLGIKPEIVAAMRRKVEEERERKREERDRDR